MHSLLSVLILSPILFVVVVFGMMAGLGWRALTGIVTALGGLTLVLSAT
jgi:hypothetical protein